MKFVAEFELKNEQLDIEYRKIFLSFIKKSLSEANEGKYFDIYFGPGKEKPYTISIHLNQVVYSRDKVLVNGKKINLYVSTPDSKTGFILFSAIASQKNKIFPLAMSNHMIMKKIKQLSETKVTSNHILIKMNEPLCIREHNKDTNKDWYYSVEQGDFKSIAEKIIKLQLENANFSQMDCNVNITPINAKKCIVKHYNCKIEASLGDFELEGRPVALDYLLKAGIGSRRSAGFGMATLLAEE